MPFSVGVVLGRFQHKILHPTPFKMLETQVNEKRWSWEFVQLKTYFCRNFEPESIQNHPTEKGMSKSV